MAHRQLTPPILPAPMWTSTQAASGATCHQRGKVAHLGRGAPTQRTGTGTQDSGATVPWRSRVAPKNRQQCSAISLEPEAHSPKGRDIPGQPASSPGSTPRARTALGGAAWQPWPPSLLAPPPPPPALWFYVFGCCSLSLHLLRANTPHGQPGAQCRVLGPERPVDTLCGCFPESGDHATLGGAPRSRWGNTLKASGSDAKVERQSWGRTAAPASFRADICVRQPPIPAP